MTHSPALSKSETLWGFAYLIFQLIFLPGILNVLTWFIPLTLLEVNLIYYTVNLAAVLAIFHRFLLANFDTALGAPGSLLLAALFGMGRYLMMSVLVGMIVVSADPGFTNFNDEALFEMAGSDLPLLALATIVLVPPVEETLFRGLIFRNLYEKNRTAAYFISTVAFAAIHLVGFLTEYAPMELFLAFLQYVPAGLCLAWAYERSGSIFAPILIHSLVNAMGIAGMR